MADTSADIFSVKYNDQLKVAFQQKQSLLSQAVQVQRGVEGSVAKFPYMGTFNAVDRTIGSYAEVTSAEPLHILRTATLTDFNASIYWPKLSDVKTNVDVQSAYVDGTVSAINRKLDDLIIAAMAAGSPVAGTGAWTFARHLGAIEALNAAEVDLEDRFMVISPAQLSAIYNEPKFTSADYVSFQPAVNGQIGTLHGVKVIVSNRLPVNTGVTSGFYFNKKAVGLAIGKDITSEINYVATRMSDLVNAYGSAGAVVIDPAGVIELAYS